MRISALFLVLALAVSAGCDKKSSSATSPTTTVTTTAPTTVYFTGTLSAKGTAFYSFTVGSVGQIAVLYASAVDTGTSVTRTSRRLTIGVPKGTGCGAITTATATPGFSSQVKASVASGIYCVAITDAGDVTGDVDYTVRIVYPQETAATSAGEQTETFASNLTVLGAASRTFSVSQSGTATITLQNLGNSSTLRAGIGVGIPKEDGSGCILTTSLQTTAGSTPLVTSAIDPGTYCIRIFDLGQFTDTTSFSITLKHP
jgi:hypothetical protein